MTLMWQCSVVRNVVFGIVMVMNVVGHGDVVWWVERVGAVRLARGGIHLGVWPAVVWRWCCRPTHAVRVGHPSSPTRKAK